MFTYGWFRSVSISAAVVALAAGPIGAVTVIGTGDPAQDVPAVQAAVDQGGTVVLSGTFDFGTHAGCHIIVPGRAGAAQDVRGQSTVFIYQHDVTISGETDESGNPITIIRNGMPPFWIGWDGNVARVPPGGTPGVDYGVESFAQDVDGRIRYRDTGPETGYRGDQTRYAVAFAEVSATIQHIHFDSPYHYGVKATCGRNVSVMNNVVGPVQWGGLIHMNGFAGATHIACGVGALARWYPPFVDAGVTGSIVFSGNRIENSGTEIIATHDGECFGTLAFMTNGPVTIVGNEIRNVGRDESGSGPIATAAGIFFCDNYGGAAVEDNTIHNAADNGMWLVGGYVPGPRPLVAGNVISGCRRGVWSQNFFCSMPGCDFRQNTIWDCDLGCYFLGNGATWAIESNTVVGSTSYGISHPATAIVTSFANNIVVGNTGYGVQLPSGTAPAVVRCNDVWNNAGGNWRGVPDPVGTNGNFSMDPLFCDAGAGDLHLDAMSPCVPGRHPYGTECGLIGALPEACGVATSVEAEVGTHRGGLAVAISPTPFTREVRVMLSLAATTPVDLQVFDATGRRIRAFAKTELSSGRHTISWDGANDSGERAAAGTYFIRLNAGSEMRTLKAVLVR